MAKPDAFRLREETGLRVLRHDYAHAPLLLLAGPGAGKTWCLRETIRSQMAGGMSQDKFLVATLTKAMATDLETAIQRDVCSDFHAVSTLHSKAVGLLHRHSLRVGFPQDFTVLTRAEEFLLLEDVACELRSHTEQAGDLKRQLRDYHERAANLQRCSRSFGLCYQQLQKFYGALDWYNVMSLACELLRDDEILKEESRKWDFFVLDEYQDLNKADRAFVRLLLNGRQALLCAGDDWQSIYSGRFAYPQGVIDFDRDYPSATTIALPASSHCPSAVLSAGHGLMQHNQCRSPQCPLLPLPDVDRRAGGSGLVAPARMKSGVQEAQFMGQALERLVQKGVPPSQVLVLCLNKDLGASLEQALHERGCSVPVAARWDDPPPGLEPALYALRLLRNQKDNLALRVLLKVLLDLPASSVRALRSRGANAGMSLWQATDALTSNDLPDNERAKVVRLRECVLSAESQPTEEAMRLFAEAYPVHSKCFSDRAAQATAVELGGQALPRESSEEEAVRFMTFHSSKGLEVDFVLIPFMEDHFRLPARDQEEQRRLLYVALTRAKVGVLFTWAWSRKGAAMHKAGGGPNTHRKRSRFVGECGCSKDLGHQEALSALSWFAERSR